MDPLKVSQGPKVFLMTRPAFAFDQFARFLNSEGIEWTPDNYNPAELIPEVAGRLCYMSFNKPRPGGNATYLKRILEVGHGSVIEHCNWGFIFTGVSRSLTHELVRHRSGWSYSQLSQRYVDETDAEFICPDVIANDEAMRQIWETGMNACRTTYKSLVCALAANLKLEDFANATELRKAARQAARSALPNATETKIFVTANARALRHFIEMRCSRHAEAEIRRLAGMVWEIMVKEAPNLFSDYQKVELLDGSFELKTEHRKI